jgi:hypothetical protein
MREMRSVDAGDVLQATVGQLERVGVVKRLDREDERLT